ncbi:YdaS family helix-turn-helix protein [Chromobacterium amazonense]|uniref:YdaS family helix-turn-helix protein n=1 Tax=Chromobacterium amazonense TaxID=1382803 RepID=UPI00237E8CA6|nr:YdaS family helix-turn-helix protein [Chromobacterium amazonense]MDE1715800.1 YdaS family helix-turn-helix protein [Chromobacterium amazonense]
MFNIPHMNPTPEQIRAIIRAAGGPEVIAKDRQIGFTAVTNWPVRGSIPAVYCPTLERLTNGAWRCEQMRPDVEWEVLRKQPGFSSVAPIPLVSGGLPDDER